VGRVHEEGHDDEHGADCPAQEGAASVSVSLMHAVVSPWLRVA
jgi:hypothetical protein